MIYKTTITLFTLLFLLTGVIPKEPKRSLPQPIRQHVDTTKIANDKREMELNKALVKDSESKQMLFETAQQAKPLIAQAVAEN